MSVRGAENAGSTGSEAKERRASGGQRVQFEALVSVGEAKGGGFEAESVDVSLDGMRLRTAYLPEVGSKLVCRFDSAGKEIVAEGEVTWRNEEARGGEFGLRFIGLDDTAIVAVRSMCASLSTDNEAEPASPGLAVPRGSRVRLHIDGLGSPMKARVRESAGRDVTVGSNLEFLKVGRSLDLEDVEQGAKREVHISDVKVDVDPATHVPQLVVMLRYEKAAGAVDAPVAPKAPATRRGVPPAADPAERATDSGAAKAGGRAETVRSKDDVSFLDKSSPHSDERKSAPEARADDESALGLGERAASVGRAVAGKLAPTLAGVGTRARDAMGGVLATIQRRRAERNDGKKTVAPRRMTAPPPTGAITNDGRRLVREDGMEDEEEGAPPRNNRRAAAMGGAVGLGAVLAIFAVTRVMGGGSKPTAAADQAIAAAPTTSATEAPSAAPGTPIANVPLFGATPLSTTEPAPAAPSGSALAAVAGDAGAPLAKAGDTGEPQGPILKEWGQGTVQHPVVLKLKMDGPVERLTGAAGAMGFTIVMPNRRSVSTAHDLTRKDKRLASVNVVNTSHGAEVTVQFKDGVPPYMARIKGDKLEIAIGREGHSKIAKSKKKSKHH